MPAQTGIHSTTQQFLDIYDITSDLLIMKDGAVSLILSVNAINFGLFAEEEQDAVIYAYAGLLNSLNYPIQIVIRSQTKDVTSYLNLLKQQEDEATAQLKKDQIKRYREFVGDLIRERNVLDKKFYVVIPANSLEMGLLPPSTVIPGVKQVDVSTVERSVIIEKARNILEPKRDHLLSQFNRIGLLARQLNTQEIIQLFYVSYNPEATEGQQITDTKSYTTPIVSAQFQNTAANLQSVIASATPDLPTNPVVDQTLTPQNTMSAEATSYESTPPVQTTLSPTEPHPAYTPTQNFSNQVVESPAPVLPTPVTETSFTNQPDTSAFINPNTVIQPEPSLTAAGASFEPMPSAQPIASTTPLVMPPTPTQPATPPPMPGLPPSQPPTQMSSPLIPTPNATNPVTVFAAANSVGGPTSPVMPPPAEL